MNTATIITIAISSIALIVSGFLLGWNIYRDVILKARVRVTVSISNIYHGDQVHGPYVSITATNLGPGPIIIQSIQMAKLSPLRFLGQPIAKGFGKENKYAYIMFDYTNEYSSQLPKRIEVGEYVTLPLLMKEDSALAVDPSHFGVLDSFGKHHWATRSSLKRAKQEFFEKFERKPWGFAQSQDTQQEDPNRPADAVD